MAEWISVKDRLPDGLDEFIGYSKFGKISIFKRRTFGDHNWCVGGYYIPKDILYWMPLPEPPKENDNEMV